MAAKDRPWWSLFESLRNQARSDGRWFEKPGITEDQVPQVRALFEETRILLPEGLLDLYREHADFGCVARMDDLFSPLGKPDGRPANLIAMNDEWEEDGVFRVADAGIAALCCNPEGKWSSEPFDYAFPPEAFPFDFDEALSDFIQKVRAQYDKMQRA